MTSDRFVSETCVVTEGDDGQPEPGLPDLTKTSVQEALYMYYQRKVLPAEQRHLFSQFSSPTPRLVEFIAKPIILVLGPENSGKNSFCRYLLASRHPTPQQSKNNFTVLMHGSNGVLIRGDKLMNDPSFPFQFLNECGPGLLDRLCGVTVNCPLLKDVIIVQSPAPPVRQTRTYDYEQVLKLLVDRVDLILVLIDSGEPQLLEQNKDIMLSLNDSVSKVRFLMNKVDQISIGKLIRSRGQVSWMLAKHLSCLESPKIFMGSFMHGKVLLNDALSNALARDYTSLFREFRTISRTSHLRKLHWAVERAKQVRVHALLMTEILRENAILSTTGFLLGRALTPTALRKAYAKTQQQYGVDTDDLPHINIFGNKALKTDANKWQKARVKHIRDTEEFVNQDVPTLLRALANCPQARKEVDVAPIVQSLEELRATDQRAPIVLGRAKSLTDVTHHGSL